ncbi:MAG: nucleotide exchange factor GrpE [Candidatus Pacebacteria bacterium]|nr:nucleotide exchange factor GrpE [Candidatus Paceibacterota bacterium]
MKKEKNNPKEEDNLQEKIIKDFQFTIEELEKKNKEIFSGWQRTEADFLNYKQKETERLGTLSSYIKEDMFDGLLPVIDNFNLAEKMIPVDKKEDNNIKGLLMIKKQFDMFLKTIGVEEIDSVGKIFDPQYNEAVEEVEDDSKESGLIIEEVQKGYLLNDKVIRPSKVRIIK